MTLRLKYFGMIAEAAGTQEATVDMAVSSVEELKCVLTQDIRKLVDINFQIAVNQSIAQDSCVLNENDEVAVLPGFAGG